jgi:hypothetical protein
LQENAGLVLMAFTSNWGTLSDWHNHFEKGSLNRRRRAKPSMPPQTLNHKPFHLHSLKPMNQLVPNPNQNRSPKLPNNVTSGSAGISKST